MLRSTLKERTNRRNLATQEEFVDCVKDCVVIFFTFAHQRKEKRKCSVCGCMGT